MHSTATATQPENANPNPASTAQTRFNAVKHGAASKQLLIPGENPDDYEALLYDCHRHYKPANLQESEIVTNLADAQWQLRRCQSAHGANEVQLYTAKPDSSEWTDADFNQLDRFDRYKANAERSLQRALKNVLTLRREKVKAAQWQQLHELQKQKFALQRERFELAQAREKRLAEMREIRQNNAANKEVSEIRSAKNAVSSPVKSVAQTADSAPPATSTPVVAEISLERRHNYEIQ